MKVFCELEIRGARDRLQAFLQRTKSVLTNGWRHNVEEEELTRKLFTKPDMFCFTSTEGEGRRAGNLWLAGRGEDVLYVSNIVPVQTGKLSMDEYNDILRDFYNRFVAPQARTTGLEVTFSGDEADLERWLSHDTAKLLRFFPAAANKSTGSAHPCDQERWYEFLIASHSEEC